MCVADAMDKKNLIWYSANAHVANVCIIRLDANFFRA